MKKIKDIEVRRKVLKSGLTVGAEIYIDGQQIHGVKSYSFGQKAGELETMNLEIIVDNAPRYIDVIVPDICESEHE